MDNISSSSSSNKSGITSEDEMELRRGPWTVDEDLSLINYITIHGEGRWNSLARCAGLKRTGKSCRLRWLNYLRPDVRRGNITLEEQLMILELHSRWGNRWSKIAQYLPGRTDNEIKNYWRTRVQKHAKQLKCDVNSKQFKDTMRYLWMPRLVERIQAASATATTTTAATTSTTVQSFNSVNSSDSLTTQVSSDDVTDYYGFSTNHNNNNIINNNNTINDNNNSNNQIVNQEYFQDEGDKSLIIPPNYYYDYNNSNQGMEVQAPSNVMDQNNPYWYTDNLWNNVEDNYYFLQQFNNNTHS